MTTINPYLTFNGNCEEAFEFYRSVFGGEFPYVGRFSEMPDSPEYTISEADKNKIMHMSLPISNETTLMGSDTTEQHAGELITGNNFSISINCDSQEETTRIFNALADGATIRMPLNKTFWGSYFGMLVDRFGISWMLNCDLSKEQG